MADERTTSTPPAPTLLGVRDVAGLLGIGTRTVWRLADAGRMPAPVRLGGRRLWRRAELVDWIDAGCPAPHRRGRGGAA